MGPFAVKLKKANRKVDEEGDVAADSSVDGALPKQQLKNASKMLEKNMAQLEEEMNKITLRKTRPGQAKASDEDPSFPKLKPLTPEEKAAKKKKKKKKKSTCVDTTA